MEIAVKNRIIIDYWVKKLKKFDYLVTKPKKIYTTEKFSFEQKDLKRLNQIADGDNLAKIGLILATYSYLIKRYFIDFEGSISLSVSLKGQEIKPVLLEVANVQHVPFEVYVQNVKKELQECLKYKEYQSEDLKIALEGESIVNASRFGLMIGKALGHECNGLLLKIESLNTAKLDFSFECGLSQAPPHLIEHFQMNFVRFLENLEELMNQPLHNIEILDLGEKNRVLVDFNKTTEPYPSERTIMGLFEDQVKKTPSKVALIFGQKKLSYFELNAQANKLGRYLREKYGVKENEVIGIKLDKSELLIVAIYGVLKAGSAYMPIDPTYPIDRIEFMKRNANCRIVLDTPEMESFLSIENQYSALNLETINSPDDLVYVIYTSGTTGNPKGVMIENRSLVNRLAWMQKSYPLKESDTLIQKTTFCFDVSVWEIFWWSIYGASLSIPETGAEKDPVLLIENISNNDVTVAHFVPSMLSEFLGYVKGNPKLEEQLSPIKQVFVSGEVLSIAQRDSFFEILPKVGLMNLYGPTEATIDVSYYDCSKPLSFDTVPIGRPIDNIQLYILDGEQRPLPIGAIGKLYISGVGLSRGYIGAQELTSEKFVVNPFIKYTKMYDSGDLARWLPDGNIEFIKRSDFQVKFKGYRIELGEIESALIRIPEITQAVVMVKEWGSNQVIVSYIICNGDIGSSQIQQSLEKILPDYMVPSFFIKLEKLPFKVNGKLDRNSLPDLSESNFKLKEYVAPENELQKEIVQIWQEVLNLERVGITDNFFEIGGHSLMATRIVNRINQKTNRIISVRDFLMGATIEQIVAEMEEGNNDTNRNQDFEVII